MKKCSQLNKASVEGAVDVYVQSRTIKVPRSMIGSVKISVASLGRISELNSIRIDAKYIIEHAALNLSPTDYFVENVYRNFHWPRLFIVLTYNQHFITKQTHL